MRTYVVPTALAACAVAVIAWLWGQNRDLRHRLEEGATAAKTSLPEDAAHNVMPRPVVVAVPAESSTRASNRSGPAPFTVATLLSDPEFRKVSIQKNVTSLEERFGRFFFSIRNLPPEKIESIKMLLAEQSFDFGQVAMPQSFPESEADADARISRMRRLAEEQSNALKTEMGETLYSQFQEYQATESFRGSVTRLANAVRARGFAISDEEQDKVLTAYSSAIARATDQATKEDPLSGQLDPAQQNALRERQTRRIQIEVTRSLAGVLEGDRLNAFLAAQVSSDLDR